MKNQYVGGVNDYLKYGLLRQLTGAGTLRLAVCWMLTENDGRSDGRLTEYLSQPDVWKRFDPVLFDTLAEWMGNSSRRDVRWIEESGILPSARFHSEILRDGVQARRSYFDRLLTAANACDLVFFDPDNGLEVKSIPYGARRARKYLYWDELVHTFHAGYSVLVFQYFPRTDHDAFVTKRVGQLRTKLGLSKIITFSTSRVVYFLLMQLHHEKCLLGCSKEISRRWYPIVHVTHHPAAPYPNRE